MGEGTHSVRAFDTGRHCGIPSTLVLPHGGTVPEGTAHTYGVTCIATRTIREDPGMMLLLLCAVG